MEKIGFGGSCHWCTEAIFQSLKGVTQVEQGWIATETTDFSEAVIVHFDPELISLKTLVDIHLKTHSSSSVHAMRDKYRSAVYTFSAEQVKVVASLIQPPAITEVLPFKEFKLNSENYLNYYYNDPKKLFCQNIINPKLRLLLSRFQKEVDVTKLTL